MSDQLVEQIAEVVHAEGYRVVKHVTTVNLEKEERQLSVVLVRSEGAAQGSLPLSGSVPTGEEPEED